MPPMMPWSALSPALASSFGVHWEAKPKAEEPSAKATQRRSVSERSSGGEDVGEMGGWGGIGGTVACREDEVRAQAEAGGDALGAGGVAAGGEELGGFRDADVSHGQGGAGERGADPEEDSPAVRGDVVFSQPAAEGRADAVSGGENGHGQAPMAQIGELADQHGDGHEDGADAHAGHGSRDQQPEEVGGQRRAHQPQAVDGQAEEDKGAPTPAVDLWGESQGADDGAQARGGEQPAQSGTGEAELGGDRRGGEGHGGEVEPVEHVDKERDANDEPLIRLHGPGVDEGSNIHVAGTLPFLLKV